MQLEVDYHGGQRKYNEADRRNEVLLSALSPNSMKNKQNRIAQESSPNVKRFTAISGGEDNHLSPQTSGTSLTPSTERKQRSFKCSDILSSRSNGDVRLEVPSGDEYNELDKIERAELRLVLRTCLLGASLQISETELEALTQTLFETTTDEANYVMSFDELRRKLESNPDLLASMTEKAKWLREPEVRRKRSSRPWCSLTYYRNHFAEFVFLIVFVLVNVALSLWNGVMYRHENWAVICARICGKPLNFNSTLICVLMLQRLFQWLRNTAVSSFLPLDQFIYFHKIVGCTILFQSVLHTAAHLTNFYYLTQSDDAYTYIDYVFTTNMNIGWVFGFASLSGVILMVILLLMVFSAYVRGRKCFQFFFWIHQLKWPFWALLILHAPDFWEWIVGPGVLFLVDYIIGLRMCKESGKTVITQAKILPSGVTQLVIARPKNFEFKAGDYVLLRIPSIAYFERRPFTISSAPEQKENIWIHVRNLGPWTSALYHHFNNYKQTSKEKAAFENVLHQVISMEEKLRKRRMSVVLVTMKESKDGAQVEPKLRTQIIKEIDTNTEVFIDGPYGMSRDYMDAEHAVLIGCGIGITPYASVIQNIMTIYNSYRRRCPCCQHFWAEDIPPTVMKLKRVDFIWINRDLHCFEWFLSLLTQLDLEQAELECAIHPDTKTEAVSRFLQIHLYMTSAIEINDMKAIGLQMALDVLQERTDRKLINSISNLIQPGRPDWYKVFAKLKDYKHNDVRVFVCANPSIGKEIKKHCHGNGFLYRQEYF